MNIKQFGGILLITGNAIGGGMLALPLATAQVGFLDSSLFLIVCWGIMLAGGLLILEINLWFPPNSHLISMARATLGGLTGAMSERASFCGASVVGRGAPCASFTV